MRHIVFFLFTLALVNTSAKAGQIDTLPDTDPVITQIQSLDFSHFAGKPVDSLLAYLPKGYIEMRIQPSIVLKRAAYLVIKYTPDTYVYIAVRSFSFMNPEFSTTGSPTQNWDINLFKKEVLSFAIAFNGSCFNGCQNEGKIN
jgi:hypothetical protein